MTFKDSDIASFWCSKFAFDFVYPMNLQYSFFIFAWALQGDVFSVFILLQKFCFDPESS